MTVRVLNSATAALSSLNAVLVAHAANTANPHAVTKAQVGLGAADNTADSAKPVSSAQQAALDADRARLTSVESGRPVGLAGTAITDIDYDLDGNVTSITEGGVTTTYTFVDGDVATETRAGVTRTFIYSAGVLTGATVA